MRHIALGYGLLLEEHSDDGVGTTDLYLTVDHAHPLAPYRIARNLDAYAVNHTYRIRDYAEAALSRCAIRNGRDHRSSGATQQPHAQD